MKYYPVLRQIKIVLFLFLILSPCFAQQSAIELKLAEQFTRTGDYESALQLYKKRYSGGDKSVKIINGLNQCLRELNYIDERISLLQEATILFPKSYNYQIDLGTSYHINEQFRLAMETWEKVYSFEPADVLRYRRVAQAMTNARLLNEAIEVYKEGLVKVKNQQTLNLDIGNLYRVQLDYENATFYLLEYYRKFKKRGGHVRSQLINMAKDDNAADRIISAIEDFNKENDPDLKELLSNLYIRKKDYDNALKIILEIDGTAKNNNFVYLDRFAKEADKDKAYNYVIKAYEYILSHNPAKSIPNIEIKLADAYYQLGIRQFKSGRQNRANKSVKKAQTLLQNLIEKKTAQKYLAAELLGDIQKTHFNDLDSSLSYYKQIKISAISKSNADRIYFKIADIHILKNQLNSALEQYKMVSSKNYKFNASFNIAELDYYNGQFSMAKEKYITLLSQIGMKDTLANNVMDRIFEIDVFSSDSSAYAEYTRANLFKRQKKYSEAAGKFQEIFNTRSITSYYAGINAAQIYIQLNKEVEAKTLLLQLIENYPDEEQIDHVYFLLANSYRKEKDLSNALTLYEEILVRFPTSLYSESARSYARQISAQIKENLN